QQACREAMQLLEHTVQPLRDLKAAAADQQGQVEQHAQAFADLEAKQQTAEKLLIEAQQALAREVQTAAEMRLQIESQQRLQSDEFTRTHSELAAKQQDLEAQLQESETALTQALNVASQLRIRMEGERISRVDAESKAEADRVAREDAEARVITERLGREDALAKIQVERIARETAETKEQAEHHARKQAEQALLQFQNAAAEQQVQAAKQVRAYSDLLAKHEAAQAEFDENEVVITRAAQLAADLERLVESERRARQDAERKVQIERQAREVAEGAVDELKAAVADQRIRAEELALAYAQLQTQRQPGDAPLKETEAALARANYAAERHAQRHAQIAADLEKERSAREQAEAKLKAERRVREEALQTVASKNEPKSFFGKLLGVSR
ncbi:MAG TPA: hypothetical protein VGO08_08775, partial [Burkholderiales bacterium]|nr:hypothetical protein [Burkholderiales bacterium]